MSHPIQVHSQPQYSKIGSQRFICAKCLNWMIEWTPVITAAMQRGSYRRFVMEDCGGIPPKVWLQCPKGCPRYVGFYDKQDKGMKLRTKL